MGRQCLIRVGARIGIATDQGGFGKMLLQTHPGEEGGEEGLDEEAEAEERPKRDGFSGGGDAVPGWLHPGQDGFKLFQRL